MGKAEGGTLITAMLITAKLVTTEFITAELIATADEFFSIPP